jgi:hypothetical protein
MKKGILLKGLAFLVLVGGTADAQTNSRHRQSTTVKPEDEYVEKYVVVTGSNIPRKVKVRRWGTDTASPVAIYDQRDIRNSGRATTEGAISTLDPSVSVHRH